MSGPVQAPAEQTPPTAQKAPAAQPPVAPAKTTRNPAIFGAVGLVLTLAAAGFVLMKSDLGIPGGDAANTTLNFVAQRDIGAAATTLTPSAAGALVEEAQRCKIPLVSMTIEKGSAAIGSTIRIRSGNYVSPYFTITEGVQRVAVPYPAPYGAGSGTMVIEGSANGAIVGFTPVKKMIDLPGTQSIPVVWRPVNPC
jgi:hypothetical protein